jgi:hypothetical protein
MKRSVIWLLLFFLHDFSASSQEARIISVTPGKKVMDVLTLEDLYNYPQFVPGTVTYQNGKSTTALMNYHVFFDEMRMLRNSDTVPLGNPDISFVTVRNDTFQREQFFYKVVRDYGKMRLVARKVFALVDSPHTPEDTSRFKLRYSVLNSGRFLKDIAPIDTLRLAVFEMYYIANVQNKLMPIHRSTLIDLYPHKRKAVLEYLSQQKVNVYDRGAIIAFLDFVTQKNYNF